jgi:hypothetical protein
MIEGMSTDPDPTPAPPPRRGGFLGMPTWFYLVVLDVCGLLLLTIWVVTQNEGNVPAYEAATTWALEILALSYLAVAFFVLTRRAIRGETSDLLPWGLLMLVALALLPVPWVGTAALGVVLVALVVFGRHRGRAE